MYTFEQHTPAHSTCLCTASAGRLKCNSLGLFYCICTSHSCLMSFACISAAHLLLFAVQCNPWPLLCNTHSTLNSCDSFAACFDILGDFTIFSVQAWTYAIEQSCLNKAAVVAADEREGGVRATLNLGHTFGHAIETGLGYGALIFSPFQS